MFEHFLTDLLKIVVALDVLGVVAYFLLGAFGKKSGVEPRDLSLAEPVTSSPSPLVGLSPSVEAGRFGQLRSRLARAVSKLPGLRKSTEREPAFAESLDAAFFKLNRVLHSYRESLA